MSLILHLLNKSLTRVYKFLEHGASHHLTLLLSSSFKLVDSLNSEYFTDIPDEYLLLSFELEKHKPPASTFQDPNQTHSGFFLHPETCFISCHSFFVLSWRVCTKLSSVEGKLNQDTLYICNLSWAHQDTLSIPFSTLSLCSSSVHSNRITPIKPLIYGGYYWITSSVCKCRLPFRGQNEVHLEEIDYHEWLCLRLEIHSWYQITCVLFPGKSNHSVRRLNCISDENILWC